MTSKLMKIVLWLFVMDLGIAFGAGLYESRIALPNWISGSPESGYHWNPEAARRDDTGRRFWVFVTTGPLTLLTLASLVLAWRAPRPVRRWWLGAAAAELADRVFTFSYFIPTMARLMNTPDSPASRAAAVQWSNLDHVRHAIVLVAWLAALKAFATLYEQEGST